MQHEPEEGTKQHEPEEARGEIAPPPPPDNTRDETAYYTVGVEDCTLVLACFVRGSTLT